jgi:hypothetical protein
MSTRKKALSSAPSAAGVFCFGGPAGERERQLSHGKQTARRDG